MSTEVNKTHVNMYSVRKGETMVPVITLLDKFPLPFNALSRKIAGPPSSDYTNIFISVFSCIGASTTTPSPLT